MPKRKFSRKISVANEGLEYEGLYDWSDVAKIDAYDIMFTGDEKIGTGKTFKEVITKAANDATMMAPKRSGLLRSTIRGKYKVVNFEVLDFYLLAGGQGFMKDRFNTAFQKTQWNTYQQMPNYVDESSKRLNIYPALQEEKKHFLERGMDKNFVAITNAYHDAYERAIIRAVEAGRKRSRK